MSTTGLSPCILMDFEGDEKETDLHRIRGNAKNTERKKKM